MAIPTADKKELAQSLGLTEAEIQLIRSPEKAKVRGAAAKGILPGEPEQTLKMMAAVALAAPEAELRDEAIQSVGKLPENNLLAYAETGSSSGILWFLYRSLADNTKLKKKLFVNRHVPIALLVDAAKNESNGELLELLAGNQAKMTENAEFPGHLIDNPNLSSVARSKVEEFFARVFSPNLLEKAGYEVEDKEEDAEIGDHELDLSDVPSELTEHMSREEEERLAEEELRKQKYEKKEEPEEEEEEAKVSLYGQIQNMSTAQKIKTAMLGNMEARKLLIKESNRLVQESVMKNPRITEPEIKAIAGNKQTSTDILRMIAGNRSWMRKYAMKLAIVQNPKLPFAQALPILKQLRDNDLKALSKSKSVGDQISKQAKQLLARR